MPLIGFYYHERNYAGDRYELDNNYQYKLPIESAYNISIALHRDILIRATITYEISGNKYFSSVILEGLIPDMREYLINKFPNADYSEYCVYLFNQFEPPSINSGASA